MSERRVGLFYIFLHQFLFSHLDHSYYSFKATLFWQEGFFSKRLGKSVVTDGESG